jgi:8-oxoguanine deaminase
MARILIKDILALETGDPAVGTLYGVDLLVDGARVARIAKDIPVEDDMEVINGAIRVVTPGFVNTHHHLYQTLTRAVPFVQDAKLFDWLVGLYEVWRHLTEEGAYVSAVIGLAELALTGCTTAADHFYLFPSSQSNEILDRTIEAARDLGVRFAPTRGSMSRGRSSGGLPPDDTVQTEAAILADYERVVAKWHDDGPESMCRVALAPCSPFSVTEELMRDTAIYARKHGLRMHTHLAETLDEEAFCLEQHGVRPLGLMERLGWLGEDVWFAHGVHFNDAELDLLAKTKTGIAHCPVSNLRLGSGIARVPEMLERGIPVGLAVDGSASNDASNMLKELQIAMLIHRVGTGVSSMPARDVLRMATSGGAGILGFEEAGVLAEGKLADLVFWRMDDVSYAGAMSDPVAALLFTGRNQTVDGNIVNGKWVVKNGQITNMDLSTHLRRANELSRGMIEAAGKWPKGTP